MKAMPPRTGTARTGPCASGPSRTALPALSNERSRSRTVLHRGPGVAQAAGSAQPGPLRAYQVSPTGALTVAGLISLAVGSIMLFQNAPGYHTSKPLVIGVAVALGAAWAFAISKTVQVRHSPVEIGAQLIAGSVGEVRENGLVYVNGELWQARAVGGQELRRGDRVRVESLDGLVLTVRPEGT